MWYNGVVKVAAHHGIRRSRHGRTDHRRGRMSILPNGVNMERGEVVRGEVSSADASGGVAFALFSAGNASRALAATEVLVIADIIYIRYYLS